MFQWNIYAVLAAKVHRRDSSISSGQGVYEYLNVRISYPEPFGG